MKHQAIKFLFCVVSIGSLSSMIGCENNDPVEEDVSESITGVTLVFTADQGFTVTRASASDPDEDGIQNLVVDKPIDLLKNKTYVMEIELINALVQPNSPHYNVSAQVAEEGEQHMFFFGWTNDLFSSPKGDGNIDARSDQVIYSGGSDSRDAKGLPLGLTTMWTTVSATGSGTFRVILKHLPAIKTQTTGTDVGETDLDVTYELVVH